MTIGHHGLSLRSRFAAVAMTAAALLASRPAGAGDDDALERAFRAGLGSGSAADARLVLRRAGTSLELRAEGKEGDGLRLTCLLCTATEQEARAFELGATLARGGIPADGQGDPGLPATGLQIRRTGLGTARLPILLGGAGLALAAAATALLLFDGECASPERDATGNCAALHDLAPVGWPLLGTGAAAIVTAIVLWILDGAGAGAAAEVTP